MCPMGASSNGRSARGGPCRPRPALVSVGAGRRSRCLGNGRLGLDVGVERGAFLAPGQRPGSGMWACDRWVVGVGPLGVTAM